MIRSCLICKNEIDPSSTRFTLSDLQINDILIPEGMTDVDIICVNCFNSALKSTTANVKKARVKTLSEIVHNEMEKRNFNVDLLMEKLENQMEKWSLSTQAKSSYFDEVLNRLELDLQQKGSDALFLFKKELEAKARRLR